MRVRNKRVLKNGVLAGYVLQKDGTWKFRFLKGKRKKQRGGGDLDFSPNQEKKYGNLIKNFVSTRPGMGKPKKILENLGEQLSHVENPFYTLHYICKNNQFRNNLKESLSITFIGGIFKNSLIKAYSERFDNMNKSILKKSGNEFLGNFGITNNINNLSGKELATLILNLINSDTPYIPKLNNKSKGSTINTRRVVSQPQVHNLKPQPNHNNSTIRQKTNNQKVRKNNIRINSNLNKKKKKLKNIEEQIKKLIKYNNSKLAQSDLFNNNNNSGLFNNSVLSQQAKNIKSKKINQKTLLRKIEANSLIKNKYKQNLESIPELNVSIKELNNLIKEEKILRKNIRNLENKNKARKKKNNKEALKLQIDYNLKLLIKLLKEKGRRGTLNSAFGSKGYKYFARELEKYNGVLNKKRNGKSNNSIQQVLIILDNIKARTNKSKDKTKNKNLRNEISKLSNKIKSNLKKLHE